MAVIGARWGEVGGFPLNADVHVLEPAGPPPLARTTADLRTWLFLDQDVGGTVPASAPPAGVTVTFETAFAFTLAAHGVVMDPASGVITVHNRPIGRQPRNFIVEAIVKAGAVEIVRVPIRFHVHHALDSVRLSPPTLTTRRDYSPRFSVHGVFDGGIVGNISTAATGWRVTAGPFVVNADGRVSPAAPPPPIGAIGNVEVTLSAAFDNRTGVGEVRHDRAWAEPRVAKLILGPGSARIDEVQNLLFLPDGFSNDIFGEVLFESAVRQIMTEVSHSTFITPFNHIIRKNRVNVWAAWIDRLPTNVEEGATIPYEVRYTNRTAGHEVGNVLPRFKRTAIRDVNSLIYRVGLPTITDLDLAGANFAAKQALWQGAYTAAFMAGLTPAIYREWAGLADRFLPPEVDSPLGIRTGFIQMEETEQDGRVPEWNVFRTQRADLNKMLDELRDTRLAGARIGNTLWGAAGRNKDLVVVLLGGARRAGGTPPDEKAIVLASMSDRSELRLGAARNVLPQPLALPPPVDIWTKVIHELGHGLALGDEYGGTKGLTQAVASLGKGWNLQEDKDTFTAGTTNPDGDLLQWRHWPRIRAAGMLDGPLVPFGANQYTVTLKRGQAAQFAMGNSLFLRQFPFLEPFGPPPLPLKPRLRKVSAPLTVRAIVNRQVLRVERTGPALTIADWPKDGAILYAPNAALTMVHPAIAAHIRTSMMPLNRAPPAAGAPPRACAPEVVATPFQPGLNVPAALSAQPKHRPTWFAWLVGAFDGGAERFCGIYHPTGACLMRTLQVPAGPHAFANYLYRLCPVCKYILVERLDPFFHGIIDREYNRYYPSLP
jgi:hypothetical protein